MGLRRYVKTLLVAADQFLNALTGGREDETVSSRAGRYDRTQPKSGAPSVGSILNKLDPGHTERAVEYDVYGERKAHGLEDRPRGAATRPTHAFDPSMPEPARCQAVVEGGARCGAPIFHPVHKWQQQ